MEENSTRHHAHLSAVMKSDVTLDSANRKGILGTHLAEQELELFYQKENIQVFFLINKEKSFRGREKVILLMETFVFNLKTFFLLPMYRDSHVLKS